MIEDWFGAGSVCVVCVCVGGGVKIHEGAYGREMQSQGPFVWLLLLHYCINLNFTPWIFVKREPLRVLHTHCCVTWRPLTTGIVKWQSPSRTMLVTRYITHITPACWNQKKKSVPLIFMANIVTRAQLRYTRHNLTPGICSLIEMHLWQICNHVNHVCFFYVCIWHVYWLLAFEAIQLKLELETNYATTQVLAYRHYFCIKETWGCVRDICIQIHAYHIVLGLHCCR